ncbi:hypothetical protein [Paenibacillus sp. FSL R7-0337]|nr:hypothetical protein [Paenibacillus sp. FSL R7-0337]
MKGIHKQTVQGGKDQNIRHDRFSPFPEANRSKRFHGPALYEVYDPYDQ